MERIRSDFSDLILSTRKNTTLRWKLRQAPRAIKSGLTCQDVVVGTGAHVRCLGKGREQPYTPLRPETPTMLNGCLREGHGLPENPVFASVVHTDPG